MKKSLIALAVLATTGAAMAQSSVTLYGVADVNVGQTKTTTNGVSAGSIKKVSSGTVNGSRFGFKGTEDLGGGLKAVFQLEQGFNIDTGSVADAAANAFNRQAFVGLTSSFGSLTAGRQYSAYDALHAATNNTYDTVLATTGTVWGKDYSSVAAYTSRVNNSVAFTSANYGGVSGAVLVGAGEGVGARIASLNVMYAAGPVLAGFAHQSEKTGNVTLKNNLIAGSYDLGMAKLTAGYQNARNGQAGTAAAEDKEVQLGVSVPFGAASIAAGVTRSESEDSAGATQSKATGVSLIGLYDLSKRTALYAGLNATKKDDTAGVEVLKTTTAQVGIRHKF